ncbi:MAG TPA: Gfo/Idh/MocA family oxidoreductase [Vicinamibacterales bacterium]|nr:Gfo/Idh/MocA family oxidoreductase [Vicinamibacterales bacterium]
MTTRSRREFLGSSFGAATIAFAGSKRRTRAQNTATTARAPRIKFAVIGVNHSHINGQVQTVTRGGGQLVSCYAKEPELAAAFSKRFPEAKLARSEQEILDDPNIQLIVSAAIPNERAPLGIKAMEHDKDFMVDKPAATTLEQLAEVRRVQTRTKRIFSVLIGRHENKSINKAGELIRAGAIGKVIQTAALAPHKMNPDTRAPWFFKRQQYGGILCDLASHNFDAYLFLTSTTRAEIVASQVGNTHHPQYPELEDFGDVMLSGDGGAGYIRVDWFTPAGLTTFGDGRLTIIGTDGYIELRENVDIAGRPGGDHLFLVDNKGSKYVDCSDVSLPYAQRLVDDVVNRTTTADSPARMFLAMQLGIEAQNRARRLVLS